MVRALRESAAAARTRRARDHRAVEEELEALGLAGTPSAGAVAEPAAGRDVQVGAAGEGLAREAEADEAVFSRLDDLGFRVGWATAERLARDRPRFPSLAQTTPAASHPSSASGTPSHTPLPSLSGAGPSSPETLEVVKFVCKDVWTALYDKQVDNLRTNHRGVYVLLDQSLRSLRALSAPEGKDEERETARWVKAVLAFPSGIIRGALSNLGVHATVTGESAGLPQASFQIKTSRPGGL
ncbi:uncharacterized protein RHOBADRAFT_38274 [Rhodotorula graminis WP1]|uniref:Trafficking protein particle complex subunit 6B n=1 Tax=Rhodotorula graminis (strain WP1) TaxID=578459 RepID=A0A0P9EJD0_RHOGW|nr:uncharacterized protein RHOBADRAFT_38274 [Rhodotorula graminis WP1]KPV73674.1 hypothetical protein RHOBADRAFT_38274 [Rhodotorula graminis WP1]